MSKRAGLTRPGFVLFLLLLPALARAQMSPDEIMRRNFYATRIDAFTGLVTMTLINDKGEERVRKIDVHSKLRDNGIDSEVLLQFREPNDIKGTGFLQIENSAGEDDIQIYLPALQKTRRLVANNKKDSFFGSDFSNGDVLLPPVDKYRHRLLKSETVDESDCYVVESVPVDEQTAGDSGYGRKLSWIDKVSFVERKVVYYDLAGALLKTQTIGDQREVEPEKHRWMPMRREMVNHQTGHRTTYVFDQFSRAATLPDQLFTTRTLERR